MGQRGSNRVRDLDTRLVRCFRAVASSGSFTQAAAEVAPSQQAVSNQIKALEKHLGASLFDRTASGVTLTDAGHQFLPHAEELLRVTDELFNDMVHDELPVRVAEVRGRHMMLDIWERHRQRYPDATVSVRDLSGDEQVDAVRSGKTDLAMTRYRPLGAGLEGCLLRMDRVLVMSVNRLSEPSLKTGTYAYPSIPGAFRAWEEFITQMIDGLDLTLTRVPFDITMMEAIGRAQIRRDIPLTLVLGGMQDYPGAEYFQFTPFDDVQPYYTWGLFWRTGERRRDVLQFIDTARQVARSAGWLEMADQPAAWLPPDTLSP